MAGVGTVIRYQSSLDGIAANHLEGFCEGWACRVPGRVLLRALDASSFVSLAVEEETGLVIGVGYAISDGVLFAYVPMLEVRKGYRGKGIGTRLMLLLLEQCQQLYGADLLCDASLQPFYARVGMKGVSGACVRNSEALRATCAGAGSPS